MTKRKLPFQICDALRLFGNLTFALGEFPSQTLHFLFQPLLVVGPRPSLGARHAAHGTLIGSICTAPGTVTHAGLAGRGESWATVAHGRPQPPS
jgi:hypothetical protein